MAFRYRDYKHGMKRHIITWSSEWTMTYSVLLWATWAPNISYNIPNSIPSVKMNIEWLGIPDPSLLQGLGLIRLWRWQWVPSLWSSLWSHVKNKNLSVLKWFFFNYLFELLMSKSLFFRLYSIAYLTFFL